MNHVLSICWVIPLYPGGFVIHKFRWCRTCQRWAYGMWAMAFLWSSLDALNRPGASDTFRCHPRLGNSPRMGKILENCRRKFRSQTSDNMDRWKAEQGRGREKRKIIREKSRRERVRRKKMQMRGKVGKSRNTVFFQWFVAPEGRKVGSLKRGCGASWPDERWKIARRCGESTFRSQNVQNTPLSDHFWKLRCRKSARRCGAKHISKWKCIKHTIVGPLLEVEMSKKCTPLWREARFEVKMYKTPHVRTTFGGSDVEKVHAVVARSTFRSQNVTNTRVSDHFWKFRCRFCFTTLHYTTLHSTTLHCTTLHYTILQLQLHNYTPLHSTTLHYTRSHYTTFHYTPLHYTILHYTTLHYTTLPSTTLHYITLRYNYNYNYTTTLHYNTLHYAKLHYTTLHYITLHYTTTTTTNTQLHS